jgi:molybdopterin/thiamine biosynthesis adenylyltransferase
MNERIDRTSWQPLRIDAKKLQQFVRQTRGIKIIDQYERNFEELFLLRNPRYRFEKNYGLAFTAFLEKHLQARNADAAGAWFYFPWSNTLVHFLNDASHQELRTGRNQQLITGKEQKKYYGATIGVLGMSIGSHVALTIAMTGGSRRMKIGDPDTISGDNLNRIRTGFQNVGTGKAVAVARQIYEMNPYARIALFSTGLTDANMERFLKGLDVLVEEMDNPYLKIRVREIARAQGIPVVMAADNGDGIIADVERYDVNRRYPILHGVLGKMRAEDLKTIAPPDIPRVVARIAGANLAHPRMLKSVLEVGKSLYSWPQLGTAATMCGSVLAYLCRRIALRDPAIRSGRYEVNPDAIFEASYASRKAVHVRTAERQKFLRRIGL